MIWDFATISIWGLFRFKLMSQLNFHHRLWWTRAAAALWWRCSLSSLLFRFTVKILETREPHDRAIVIVIDRSHLGLGLDYCMLPNRWLLKIKSDKWIHAAKLPKCHHLIEIIFSAILSTTPPPRLSHHQDVTGNIPLTICLPSIDCRQWPDLIIQRDVPLLTYNKYGTVRW